MNGSPVFPCLLSAGYEGKNPGIFSKLYRGDKKIHFAGDVFGAKVAIQRVSPLLTMMAPFISGCFGSVNSNVPIASPKVYPNWAPLIISADVNLPAASPLDFTIWVPGSSLIHVILVPGRTVS